MIIIKIGGGAGINLQGIVGDLAQLREKFIIVHGANALRDKLAEDLGRPKKVVTSVSGYSSVYSDENLIDQMMMAYAGARNKRIVDAKLVFTVTSVRSIPPHRPSAPPRRSR